MKNLLIKMYYGIFALMVSWGMLSWLEIMCKNLSANPQYSELNLFKMIF